ncbi:MAG: hypothetical protein ACE5HK_04335 [Candidatus Methylomirabilales bacterium]
MEVLTLIIAVVALVVAVLAYRRTGGMRDLRRQVESLDSVSESVRAKTADALSRVERMIRGKEKDSSEKEEGPPPPSAV